MKANWFTWISLFAFPAFVFSQNLPATPCATMPEYRQLDFWVGDWDVWANDKRAGKSTIRLITGDCVIFENYESAGGYSGKSFNIYNQSLKKWQQFWVDNQGGVLEFSGERVGSEMRYRGQSKDESGKTIDHRMTLVSLERDRVRQLWEQSEDAQKTWTTVFDGLYVREQSVGANNWFPQWSPDGMKLAFTSDRDGDPEIYVSNVDGSNVVRLTHAAGRDAHPNFSPDNRKIVFQSPRANGEDTNIYVMESDGSNVVQLTKLKGFLGVPSYSPDGRYIALQWRPSRGGAEPAKWRICIMDADGANFRVVTAGEANDQVPNWSSDGKRLLFYSDRTGKDQIYTMDLFGRDVRRVAETEFNDRAASWSPDNAKIAFVSDRSGSNEIYVMDAHGNNVRRLTRTEANERAAVWSPDGTRMVFASDGVGPSRIFLMKADGSGLVKVH